eukprot:762846-Hanusia_phi.AAC.3
MPAAIWQGEYSTETCGRRGSGAGGGWEEARVVEGGKGWREERAEREESGVEGLGGLVKEEERFVTFELDGCRMRKRERSTPGKVEKAGRKEQGREDQGRKQEAGGGRDERREKEEERVRGRRRRVPGRREGEMREEREKEKGSEK